MKKISFSFFISVKGKEEVGYTIHSGSRKSTKVLKVLLSERDLAERLFETGEAQGF
jgi:hypothetical protein